MSGPTGLGRDEFAKSLVAALTTIGAIAVVLGGMKLTEFLGGGAEVVTAVGGALLITLLGVAVWALNETIAE